MEIQKHSTGLSTDLVDKGFLHRLPAHPRTRTCGQPVFKTLGCGQTACKTPGCGQPWQQAVPIALWAQWKPEKHQEYHSQDEQLRNGRSTQMRGSKGQPAPTPHSLPWSRMFMMHFFCFSPRTLPLEAQDTLWWTPAWWQHLPA